MDILQRLYTKITGRAGGARLVTAATGLIIVAAACGSAATDRSEDGSTDGSAAATQSEDAAPSFEIEAFGNENFTEGQPISLDTFEDRPIVLNFWYPSCPPCRLEMPHFEAAFQSHKDDLAFIGIQQLGLDSADEGQEFIKDFGLSYAIGPDGKGTIIREYEVISFPTTLFLDSNHEVVRKWAGPLNEEKLNELIEEILPTSS